MRRWDIPKLLTLSDYKVFANSTNFGPPTHGSTDDAFCHNGHNDSNGLCIGAVNKHSASGKKDHTYSGILCPDHGPGNEACCCYKAPGQS